MPDNPTSESTPSYPADSFSADPSESTAGDCNRTVTMILFLVAIGAVIIVGGRIHSARTPLHPPQEREPAAPIAVTTLDGQPWTLASHRNQVVLVNYWATWCDPCLDEFPTLKAIQKANPQLAILAISLDTGSNASTEVHNFTTRYQTPWPTALDLQPDSIVALPTTLLIDRQGRLARTIVGGANPRRLARDIATLLAEPPTRP
jgi:thiol-disulfide isomerase/thioredoxin